MVTLLPAPPAVTLLMKNEIVIERIDVESLNYLSSEYTHQINGNIYSIGLNRDFLIRKFILFVIKMKYTIIIFVLLPIVIGLTKFYKRKFMTTK